MRTKRLSLLPGVALVVLLTLGVGTPVFGHDGQCSLATLDGLYVFSATGFVIPPTGPVLQEAILELIRFNGDGTVSVPGAALSLNGTILGFPPGGRGTYTVADLAPVDGACVGSLTFFDPPSIRPTFNLVIPLRGEKIWMIQTNPTSVLQGTATKLSR